MKQTTTQQNSEDESPNLETMSSRMAEYWNLGQQAAQKFGVTATLIPQNKDHSTTPKTRFVFLAGRPQTESEQNPIDQK
ncbi:MAG: hypothetical protein RL630_1059 [Verrucomicrobiota bacterium]|jgi:hypothetical protein